MAIRTFNSVTGVRVTGAVAAAVAAAAALAGNVASAADTAAADTKSGAGVLEEIVVTARRREEDIQTVPVSIAVISGEQLVQRGFETQESFNRMVPNVVIHGSNGFFGRQEGGFQMRGIGNVTVYYDGIAHPETFGVVLSNILEMDHVEVLRGPQGTLFGKDTMGGAIQYVTKAPSDTFGARGKVTVGSYNRVDIQGIVDFPITDTLLTKVTVGKFQRDGYLQSVSVPMSYGSQSDTLANLDVLWKPTDKFSWKTTYTYMNDMTNGAPVTDWAINTGTAGAANPCAATNPANKSAPDLTCLYNAIGLTIPQTWAYGASQDYKTAEAYQGPSLYTNIRGIQTNATYLLSDTWTGKFLGGYRSVRNLDYTSFDGTKYNIFGGKNYNEQEESTLEAQLLYSGSRLTGTNGVFEYQDNRRAHRMNWFQNELKLGVNAANNAAAIAWLTSHVNPATGLPYPTFADAAGGPVGGAAAGDRDVNSLQYNYSKGWAVFSEWTYKFTDKLSATVGARYNSDKVLVRNYAPLYPLPVLCCNPIPSVETNGAGPQGAVISGSFTNTAPKASVQYQWSRDVMTYASYSEGFNRGGASPTNSVPIVLIPFQPEKLKSMEIGLRADLLDRRLRFNASLFYANYDNLQVSQDVNKINVTRNAGKAVTKGVELDGYWAFTDYTMLNYSAGTDSATVTTLAAGVTANITVGQTLAYAPKSSFSLGLSHEFPFKDGAGLTVRGDYGWQSEQWSTNDFTNRVLIPSYGLMNARATWHAADNKWELALSASNLLNKYYRINGYLVPNLYVDVGTPGRPRELALSLSTKL